MNLFARDDDVDSHGCPVKDESGPAVVPLVNGMTFHTLAVITAGACTAFAALVSAFLISDHALHFSNPREQTLIMRIILLLPLCSVVAFLCVLLDSAALYLKPGIEFVESFALACFFLLMLAYIYPDDDMGQGLFEKLNLRPTKKKEGKMKWYKMTIISVVTTGSTLASIFITYAILKVELKPFRALSKFVTFKLIISLNFIQTTVFSFLMSSTTIKPTNHLTFDNIYFGIPNLIFCIEMALMAPLFVYAYPAKPYYRKNRPNGFANYHASSSYGLKALWSIVNISDLVLGLTFAFRFAVAAFNKDEGPTPKYAKWPGPGEMDHERTSYSSSGRWRYQNVPSRGISPSGYSGAQNQPVYDGTTIPLGHMRGDSRNEMYPLRGGL
ncbi:hypothetical protein FQN54_008831 [Arachnomyces sp. PD_36]|nr:hypothetical protein FQN54_008831 [Arachnomyces sp. PD_36]